MQTDSPSEILGVDLQSASEKDLRRAYARKLKVHRPDRDPEGFRRLREAYEVAQQKISFRDYHRQYEKSETIEKPEGEGSWREVPLPDPESGDSADTISEEKEAEESENEESVVASAQDPTDWIPETPSELKPLEEKIEALVREERGRSLEMAKVYEEGTRICVENPEMVGPWGALLYRYFEETPESISTILSIADLLRELENEARHLTDLVVPDWIRRREFERLESLVMDFVKNQKRLTNPVAAEVFVNLANAIGFILPERSSHLLDLAYPNLAIGYRDYLVRQAEYWMAKGRLFSRVMTVNRLGFWSERFRDPERDSYDWTCEEARNEVKALIDTGLVIQPILDVLQDIVPPEIWKQIAKGNVSKRPEPSTEYQVDYGSLIPKVLIFLAVIGFFIAKYSTRISPPSYNRANVEEILGKNRPLIENQPRKLPLSEFDTEEAFGPIPKTGTEEYRAWVINKLQEPQTPDLEYIYWFRQVQLEYSPTGMVKIYLEVLHQRDSPKPLLIRLLNGVLPKWDLDPPDSSVEYQQALQELRIQLENKSL